MNKFSNPICFPKVRCVISYLYYFFCSLILLTHGDVETNPGPKKSHSYFSCSHWDVNSPIAHNKLKVSLPEAWWWCLYVLQRVISCENDKYLLQECLLCEVMIDNIRGCIALIYRSPSQNSLEFQHFLSGFEQLLINIEGFKPNFTVLLGDYNARSRSWWASDTNTSEGMQLDALIHHMACNS